MIVVLNVLLIKCFCTEHFSGHVTYFCSRSTVTACAGGTMDVINRLKSAVTNVLPVGNPITNEFEILGQRASGGPALLWKVYDGIQRSTKQAWFRSNFFLCPDLEASV